MTSDGESATRSWAYANATGFREEDTRYGIVTTYTPHAATGVIASSTDAHNHTTSFTYDWGVQKDTTTPTFTIGRSINPDGTVASDTRRGFTTHYVYDAVGRLEWVKPPVGHWFETRYDHNGAAWVESRRSDGGSAYSATTTWLDGFGRAIATENTLGVKTRTAYDALGRTVYASLPYTIADVGTRFRYDALNRLRETETTDGKTVTYAYPNGIDVAVTDEESRTTTHDWAAFGRPDDARLVGLTDAEHQSWTYRYNVGGRLTRVEFPNEPAREWHYTGELLSREVHPESGDTTYTYHGGRLATRTTARGTMTFGYDANDRLTAIDVPGGTDHDVTLGYDDADNRTVVQNSFVTSRLEFDAGNRLVTRQDTIAGQPARETVYGYDGWDNLRSLTYPSGTAIAYEYDREHRVTRVSTDPHAALVAEVLEYHPSGAIKRLQFANGIEEDYTFDAQRYWLRGIAGGPVQLTYGYDGVGNVRAIDDGRDGFDQSFTYDAVDRLRFVTGWGANTYYYDAGGNRLSKASPPVTYTYQASTRRLTQASGAVEIPEVGTYTYDGVGNLTSDRAGAYSYTPFNLLETATVAGATTTYRYDGDNLRAMRVTAQGADSFFHGLGNLPFSEFTQPAGGAPRWVRDHLYLGGRLVASLTAAPLAPPPPQPVTSVSLTAPAAPYWVGQTLTWTAQATGGTPPVQYEYWLFSNASQTWTRMQSYSPSAQFTWRPGPGDAGIYQVQVRARRAGSTAESEAVATGAYFEVRVAPPVIVTALATTTVFPAAPQTPITWTASASGGLQPLEYAFHLYSGASQQWTLTQGYSASRTYTFTPGPNDAGHYAVQVWVRSTGSGASYQAWRTTSAFEVSASQPVQIPALPADVPFPAAPGTPITWTAAAYGGTAPLEYQFWRHSYASGVTTLVQDYSPVRTFPWTPGAGDVGNFSLQVLARSTGSGSYEAWRWGDTPTFTISSTAAATLSSVVADRGPFISAQTPIAWRATATGGSSRLLYRFWIYHQDTGAFTLGRDYAPDPVFTWTPATRGTYHVQVVVRSTGTDEATFEATRWADTGTVYVAALPQVTLTADVTAGTTVAAGTLVTVTAQAVGELGPYEYQFWRYSTALDRWDVVQVYGTPRTYTWTATAGGSLFAVWVRASGSSQWVEVEYIMPDYIWVQ